MGYKLTTTGKINGKALVLYCEGCGHRMTDDEYAMGAGHCDACIAQDMEKIAGIVRGGQGTGHNAAWELADVILWSVGTLLGIGAAYGLTLLTLRVLTWLF